MKPVCPECGGKVFYSYTCHTYKQGERWMSCLPCDSAVDYDCYADDCGWGYTHGFGPRQPACGAQRGAQTVLAGG